MKTIFSKRSLLVYGIVFVLSILLSWLQVPFGVTLPLLIAIVTFLIIIPYIKPLFWGKDIEKIEAFLLAHPSNTHFTFVYALANRQDQKVDELVTTLLEKNSKNRSSQALYKAMHGLYYENVTAVQRVVGDIQTEQYRLYYQGYIYLEEGDFQQVESVVAQLKQPWMKKVLLSKLQLKQGDMEGAIAYAKEALQACRGLQYYALYRHYQQQLPEAL